MELSEDPRVTYVQGLAQTCLGVDKAVFQELLKDQHACCDLTKFLDGGRYCLG